MNKNIIRLPKVQNLTGLSRSTIYAYIQAGKFPTQIELGPRSRGWLESEIYEWISSRVSASRTETKETVQ